MLKITLFGTPTLFLQNKNNFKSMTNAVTNRGMALLAYLAVTGVPHDRSTLADLLWADVSEKQAKTNLRYVLYDLKKVFEEHFIVTRRTLAFNRQVPYWLDVEAFSSYISSPDAPQHMELYQEALDLYQNSFLAGFYIKKAPVFEEWVRTQQDFFQQEAIQGFDSCVKYCIEQSDYAAGLSASKRLLALEPWNEEIHCQHMRMLAYDGQRSTALAHYAVCRQTILDEYGVEPLPETQQLYDQIRTNTLPLPHPQSPINLSPVAGQIPTVDVAATPSSAIEPNHKHSRILYPTSLDNDDQPVQKRLHNFPAHIDTFIGRKKEIGSMMGYLDDPMCRLITVTGAGGVGKTYFIQKAVQQWAFTSVASEEPLAIYYVSLADVDTDGMTEHGIVAHDMAENGDPQKRYATDIIGTSVAGNGFHMKDDRSHQAISVLSTQIAKTIASAINTSSYQSQTYQEPDGLSSHNTLEAYLVSRPIMLVLDHFEHFTPATNWLIHLLQKSPNLRLVITSRKRLNVSGEQTFALQGLTVLDKHETYGLNSNGRGTKHSAAELDLSTTLQNDAVQLFLYRAKLVNWQFEPSKQDLYQILDICRIVEGLPLGIELAANWLRIFDCATIARRLEENIDFLESKQSDIPARHRAPRTVFNDSWQLLTGKEKNLLMYLASRKDTFTFDEVQANGPASISHLLQLLDHSFVRISGDGQYRIPRFVYPYIVEKSQTAPVPVHS